MPTMKRSVYEKLAAKAEEVGGVGRAETYNRGEPHCLYGIAHATGVLTIDEVNQYDGELTAHPLIGVSTTQVDDAHRRVGERHVGHDSWTFTSLMRFPLDDLLAELNVIIVEG